jgi:hypothetical protein
LPVRLGKEAIDDGLEIDDGAEDAAFEAAAGQLGEVAFDGVEPRGRCWGEALIRHRSLPSDQIH